jgi:hypothetical protein
MDKAKPFHGSHEVKAKKGDFFFFSKIHFLDQRVSGEYQRVFTQKKRPRHVVNSYSAIHTHAKAC